MNKTILILILVLILAGIAFFIFTRSANKSESEIMAKRSAPKTVTPIEYNGVVYSAPTGQMGYVIAKDIKTSKTLVQKE